MFITGRDKDNLEKVADEVKSAGGKSDYGVGDVGNAASVASLSERATKFFDGKVPDVLVANAGVGRFGALEDVPEEDFDLSFNTNVKGVFLWLRAVLPGMKKANAGQIVVTSSTMGLRCGATAPIYCSTKWALQGMVGSVRQNLKGTKVKIGTVNPGAVATPWWIEKHRGGKTEVPSEDKLAKMLTPEDVASSIVHMVEQGESSNIDTLSIDPRDW